jgi:hypothetical protein
MRAIWAMTLMFSSLGLLSRGLAQDEGGAPPPAAVKIIERALEPTQERNDLTPAQLRDLAATLKINKALDVDTTLDVTDQPLVDVIRQIAETHKIPIVLDPEGL